MDAGSDCNGTKIDSIERIDLKTLVQRHHPGTQDHLVPHMVRWLITNSFQDFLHEAKIAHADKNCTSNS